MYAMVTVMNSIIEYKAMNLKHWILVTNAVLPSLSTVGMHEISDILLVNGAAIDASA